ncbi:hypothetical protein EUTSA_v10028195mg [Eutrema salsugineum]|uniref:F-box domain-containing protein n=1 Tax=Eutrema salsugineum TaxID=72664 RepID=V4M3P0_EUTSA|nr:hypothetical protein EUTSA_v10028195mg [Eutrema salsugineum]
MSKNEAKLNQEMLVLRKDQAPRTGANLSQSEPKGQEAGYAVPQLLEELKVEIFCRVSCFDYWKMQFLNKQVMQLLKTGEIFRMRRKHGLVKPYVLIHSGGETCWTMFDKDFENFGKLPTIPSDDGCFFYGDKETISAGAQLIVIGREVEGIVVWRYELESHKWFKGPAIITPKVMYGSASRGTDAFFAGGIKVDENGIYEVVNTLEKYNADTKMWTVLHGMHKRRKFSSGCFLHGKFYVVGGRDENDKNLTCGERYDEVTNSWELIPNMLKDMTLTSSQSPPLIAVVDNNLYLLETSLNELCIYDINANAWKKLGVLPVRANAALGWGVAFKSIGDRLLVIGPSSSQSWHRTTAVYTCWSFSRCGRAILEGIKTFSQLCPSPPVYPKLLRDVCLSVFLRRTWKHTLFVFAFFYVCVYNKFAASLMPKHN